MVIHRQLDYLGWNALVLIPQVAIEASIRGPVNLVLGGLLVGLVLLSLLAILGLNKLVLQPIRSFSAMAAHIARTNDLDQRILINTRDEIGELALSWNGMMNSLKRARSRLEATEQELIRLARQGELASFRTLHLATHAFADPQRPERSSLILSQVGLPDPLQAALAGERVYDGRLTVQEILQEWRLEADLVTLSACETGLGLEVAGEGLVGFAHAFLQVGARALLVSLWKVDDLATSLLMERFYENLWQRGLGKAAALKEAKSWLRDLETPDGRRPFAHPFYWSAFVLIGDRD